MVRYATGVTDLVVGAFPQHIGGKQETIFFSRKPPLWRKGSRERGCCIVEIKEKGRSGEVTHLIAFRTKEWTASRGSVVFSGRRRSIP